MRQPARRQPARLYQKREPVQNGTQVFLARGFNTGQLVYTAPFTVEGQTMYAQLDTGSSDLWFASDRCTTSSCKDRQGYEVYLFADNLGLETGQGFDIRYLFGGASGPIILSNVSFANTVIRNQAFSSANYVDSEQLGPMNASGIVGLGLPVDSTIQDTLTSDIINPNNTQTNVSQTGSLLPGLWSNTSIASRYFGVGLQRLPSDGGNGNSTLTFGGIDGRYVPGAQQSSLHYTSVVNDNDGLARKWKVNVNDVSVNFNGTRRPIPLSSTGVAYPTAIIDSSAPLNRGSVNFLNALYGAVNVGPAADGSGEYYVNCSMPLEISITIGGYTIPLHPLDSNLKFDASGTGTGGTTSGCIGSFQAVPGDPRGTNLGAQMVLGAPFMRSVYSVFGCDNTTVGTLVTSGSCSNPRVGLYGLYNEPGAYSQAVTDFNKVRLKGEALGDNSVVAGSAASVNAKGGFGTSAKIAVAVVVSLVGLLALMAGILVMMKRRKNRMLPEESSDLVGSGDHKEPMTPGTTELSERERQKARELALLRGEFVEDTDGDGERPMERELGVDSQGSWDVSSKGYWEARAIKHAYQKRMRQSQQPSNNSGETSEPNETHELVDTSTFGPK